jgi:hypothetical protein
MHTGSDTSTCTRVDRAHAELFHAYDPHTHPHTLHRDVSLPRRRARCLSVCVCASCAPALAAPVVRLLLHLSLSPVSACVSAGGTFSRVNSARPPSESLVVCWHACVLQEEAQRKRAAEAEAARKRAEVWRVWLGRGGRCDGGLCGGSPRFHPPPPPHERSDTSFA